MPSSSLSSTPPPSNPAVILSRVPTGLEALHGGQFTAISAELAKAGVAFAVVDSIYDLPDDSPVADFLRHFHGGMIFLGWHYPRALKWILARHSVGQAGQTPSSGSSEIGGLSPTDGVHCLDARLEPGALLVQVLEFLGGSVSPLPRAGEGGRERSERGVTECPAPAADLQSRWYPVLDHSQCTNCMECLDFCLFGVYGVDAQERLRVVSPDQCRQDCPACARVCAASAIIFPKYRGDPAIAGAEQSGSVRPRKLDLSGIFGGPKDHRLAAQERESALRKLDRKPAGLDNVEQLSKEFDKLKL